MKKLYAIVHKACIDIDLSLALDGERRGINFLPNEAEYYQKIADEIARIKKSEEFIDIIGDPAIIPYKVPEDTQILVCGAPNEVYVRLHITELQKRAIPCEVYVPATVFLFN
jgi:hypothetical protein